MFDHQQQESTHCILRGHVYLYREKAPWVKSGHSVHGGLEYNPVTDEIKCHECGKWFKSIATHLRLVHPETKSSDYKARHGLRQCTPIISPGLSSALRDKARVMGLPSYGPRLKGNFPAKTEKRRTSLHEQANVNSLCEAQLMERLAVLAKKTNGKRPTIAQCAAVGIHPQTVLRRFSLKRFEDVFGLLGLVLTPAQRGRLRLTREYLIERIRDFWATHGRLPVSGDSAAGLFPSAGPFRREFGKMSSAFEAAGLGSVYKESQSQRARAALAHRPHQELQHGTHSMYTTGGCRCELCLQGTREYQREWRAAKSLACPQ